jgi:hypothetical protein
VSKATNKSLLLLHLNTNRKKYTDKCYSPAYISEIVTIEVGENKRAFQVHRGLLTFYSGYFKGALDGDSTEAQNGIMKLKIEEPAVLEEFVTWLYSHKLRTESVDEDNPDPHYEAITKLWIFADRRDIPLLMNEMIDNLQHSVVSAWTLPNLTLRGVYDNTTEQSTLRRMIVDMYAAISGPIQQESLDDFPKQFLFDWLNKLARSTLHVLLTKESYRKIDMCSLFHVHERGVRCGRTGTKRTRDSMQK